MDKSQAAGPPSESPTVLGRTIQQRMRALGLHTVSQVAAKVNRSIGTISGVLKGKKTPSEDSLTAIATFLDMSLEEVRAIATKDRETQLEARTSRHKLTHSESSLAYERAVLTNAFASALSSIGGGEARGSRDKSKDPQLALDDAREAYEADIASRALAGVSPRVLTLLRRMTPRQQQSAERMCEALLDGGKVGIVSELSAPSRRSEGHRTRRERRSRRLTATHQDDLATELGGPAGSPGNSGNSADDASKA